MPLVKKTKAKIKMLEMGLVPAFTGKELVEMLKSLSAEEQVIAKRKFRKQWRKILKEDKRRGYPPIYDIFDPHDEHPSKRHLRNRACIVISKIFSEIKD